MPGWRNAVGARRRRETATANIPDDDPNEDFAWFFREEFPRVVRTVWLIVRDRPRAEDVAQDAFVQLLRHWRKVSRYEMPDAWVRRVAIRMAVRTARRDAVRGLLERNVATPPEAPGADPDLLRAVGRLSAAQRAAVVLFYFEDRPVSQVADVLGCSANTVKVHLHRARNRLHELIGEEAGDDA